MTELTDVVQKKEPPIFVYRGMMLTLKLPSRSSDSTKMPFLPAIRPRRALAAAYAVEYIVELIL